MGIGVRGLGIGERGKKEGGQEDKGDNEDKGELVTILFSHSPHSPHSPLPLIPTPLCLTTKPIPDHGKSMF